MGEAILICLIVVWGISPVVLLVLVLASANKRARQERFLEELWMAGRISAQERQQLQQATTGSFARMQPPQQPWTNPQPSFVPPGVSPIYGGAGAAVPPVMQPFTAQPPVAQPPTVQPPVAQPTTAQPPVAQPSTAQPPVAQPSTAQPPTVQPSTEQPPMASVPRFVPPTQAGYGTPTFVPPVGQATYPKPLQPAQQQKRMSAITAMLAVGVVLIVLAGMLFVRASWNTLGSFGRLSLLAAGSVVFFGASALAQRLWKLQRTGMAFFSLGTAFLPISIWAAGYFELLGPRMAGSDNPWLLTLAAFAFTAVAVLATRLYRQIGWGIATLCGVTITYACLTQAMIDAHAAWTLSLAVYAFALVYLAKPLATRLPAAIGKALEPFSLVSAFVVMPFVLFHWSGNETWFGGAALAVAATFLAPVVTERMRDWSSLPMGLMAIYGFANLFQPLYENDTLHFSSGMYAAFVCALFAVVILLLVSSDSLSEAVTRGYRWMFYGVAGFALLVMVVDGLFSSHWAESWNWLSVATAVVLLLATLLPALRLKTVALRAYVALEAAAVSIGVGMAAFSDKPERYLLMAGIALVLGVVFVRLRVLRTTVSDFTFPTLTGIASLLALQLAINGSWQAVVIAVLMGLVLVAFLFFALEHGTQSGRQYVFASMVPLVLIVAINACSGAIPKLPEYGTMLLWMGVSLALGFFTYFTTKKRFCGVRKLLFFLTILPPMGLGLFAGVIASSGWAVWMTLLNCAAAVLLYITFANRGMKALTYTMVTAALVFAVAMLQNIWTFYGIAEQPLAALLLTGLLIVGLGVLALFIQWDKLFFVGDYALAGVMAIAVPLWACYDCYRLMDAPMDAWNSLALVFALGLCVLGWMLSKPENVWMPSLVCLGAIFALDSLRQQIVQVSTGIVCLLLLAFAGLMAIFLYLGLILHETKQRRAWVLTGTAGIIPIWLGFVISDLQRLHGDYHSLLTDRQQDWMQFFIPLLWAGFAFHFHKLSHTPTGHRRSSTAAAVLATIALWMQPFVVLENTYWELKYYLLPLIGFGVVLRRLYGKRVGSGWLFAIGVFAMCSLGLEAMSQEQTADLLTVLVCALAIFVTSFFIKQRKWFLLGGVSLCGVAIYVRVRVFPQVQWWAFLLIAGVLLIGIAAANEMYKQKGESLKVKAGRMWDDWNW